MERTVTFKTVGNQKPLVGRPKNPDATLGSIGPHVAKQLGVAGTFEFLDSKNEVLDPDMRLADLPDEEITLAPELTPA